MVRLAEQQQQLSCEHVCMLLKRSTAIRHCVHAVCDSSPRLGLIPAPDTGDMCIVRSSVRSDALRERMFTDMWWWVPCCENGPLNYELARSHMNSLSHDLRRRLIDVLNSMEWSVCAGQVLFKFKQFQLIITICCWPFKAQPVISEHLKIT